MTIKVLLVDDQAVIRAGLALLIDQEPDMEVVGHAGDGLEAIELARSLEPDIVLMDIKMPRLDGVEATRILTTDEFSDRENGPLQVIVLTTYDADESVYAALRAGASGFMLKDATPDSLPNAVRLVSSGEGWLDGKIVRRLLPEFAARPVVDVPTRPRCSG